MWGGKKERKGKRAQPLRLRNSFRLLTHLSLKLLFTQSNKRMYFVIMFIVRMMKMTRLEESVYVYIYIFFFFFFSFSFFLIIIDRSNQAILINYYIEYNLVYEFVISEVEIHEEEIVYRQEIVK